MRHGATLAQALAGTACTVLLASCGATEPAFTAEQSEPAAQVEVEDRAPDEEPDDAAAGAQGEQDEQAAEPAAENAPAEDEAFDPSGPVVDAASDLGVTVSAPEGFLETEEFAALESEISALVEAGHSVSVRAVDLETGVGVSYNAGEVRYPASAIKAAYCAYVCETYGGSAGLGQTMADCLLNSSNTSYETLIETFKLAPFAAWLTECGATGAGGRAYDHYYPDITANELVAVWREIWRYGTSGEAGAEELTGLLAQTSFSPSGDALRDEHEVWAKAGWYPADGTGYTSTNDAGVVISEDGAYAFAVMTDLSADLDRLVPLISALDDALDTMR